MYFLSVLTPLICRFLLLLCAAVFTCFLTPYWENLISFPSQWAWNCWDVAAIKAFHKPYSLSLLCIKIGIYHIYMRLAKFNISAGLGVLQKDTYVLNKLVKTYPNLICNKKLRFIKPSSNVYKVIRFNKKNSKKFLHKFFLLCTA